MTSAWKEPSGRDDRAEGQDTGPDENQLEMFDMPRRAGPEMLLPPGGDLVYGGARPDGGGPRHVEITDVSGRDFLDVGGADSHDLRRLEDSIRWLMNEGSVRQIPRAATLPPVRGLAALELRDDDSLLLNPDTLFPPRSARRPGSVVRGAAKFLLVSAIAAPTAYFIANWIEFPGTAAPSDSAALSDSATVSGSAAILGPLEEWVAAVAPTPRRAAPEAAQTGNEISGVAQPEPVVRRGMSLVETTPGARADISAAEPNGAPEQPPGIAVARSEPEPIAVGANAAESRKPPPPAVAAPPKPVLSAAEITLMVERGRTLFEAGDIAAARLFFRRAANAGDAAAAIAMGSTYDPDVLSRRFIRGIESDAREARMWYERAKELGSPEGPRRIEMLAHR